MFYCFCFMLTLAMFLLFHWLFVVVCWPPHFTHTRYRPTLPLEFIIPELGFSDRDECLEFLKEMNVTLVEKESRIDCKASVSAVNVL